ncbi:MAG: formyltetrahydrofolate deformylase [Betaproteobacteria bacterium]|nr:formyltetrahydrofolate deformylase [Betaproteobacteria bacterium]
MSSNRRFTIVLSCPDRVGIIAAVSAFVAGHKGWTVEAGNFADAQGRRFFMRQEILADTLPFDVDQFREAFAPIAEEYGMDWRISDSAHRKRLVILVSKQGHCLYDLLARWRDGELNADIASVISNHDTFRSLVEWHGIPFHHVPVTPDDKERAFAEVSRLYDEAGGEVMVLARYMQILSPAICDKYRGQIINIHHSFLPSFIGGRPYHQAYVRGVKLIGATCHYVTTDLDEGPIIEQDVIRVDHSDEPDDLVRYGRDIEKVVLARGLRYHLEDRVLLDGNKTVVLR